MPDRADTFDSKINMLACLACPSAIFGGRGDTIAGLRSGKPMLRMRFWRLCGEEPVQASRPWLIYRSWLYPDGHLLTRLTSQAWAQASTPKVMDSFGCHRNCILEGTSFRLRDKPAGASEKWHPELDVSHFLATTWENSCRLSAKRQPCQAKLCTQRGVGRNWRARTVKSRNLTMFRSRCRRRIMKDRFSPARVGTQ